MMQRTATATLAVAAPQALAPSRKWLVLIATALGVFMGSLDLTIVNVSFPSIERTFSGTSTAALSWVINAYTIAFGSLLIVSGRLADRLGRKRTFLTGIGIFTVGSLACGIAPNVPMLIAGRVVQGVGAALMTPASLSLLLAGFPAHQRPTAIAIWGAVGALATAIGPTLGAALVEGPGWRWVFIVNLPVAGIAVLLGRQVLEEFRDGTSGPRLDAAAVVLITIAMAALSLGIVEGRDWGYTSPRILASFAVAALMVPVFLYRGFTHPSPVVDPRLFRVRSFAVANLTMALYAIGFFSLVLGNVLFLTSVWHYSIMRAGLAITPAPVTAAIISPFAGRLAQRHGFRPLIVFGNVVSAAGVLSLALRLDQHPDYLATWLPASIIIGFGIGSSFSLISGATVSALPAARFGLASAVNQTCRQLGSIIGVATLVAIIGTPATRLEAVDAFHNAYFFTATALALAAVAAVALGTRPAAAEPARA